jgi:hypothetical protein
MSPWLSSSFADSTMKPQTQDNLRCLAAVVFIFAVLIGVFATQPWLLSLPAWVQVAAVVILLFAALRVFNLRLAPERDRVAFDDSVITRTLPDGKTETVRWDDLQEVGIVTTDEGPAVEDVYWMLLGRDGGCALSGGAQGMEGLLSRLQRLPGFDNEAVIKAMGSTTNDKFVCWKRT